MRLMMLPVLLAALLAGALPALAQEDRPGAALDMPMGAPAAAPKGYLAMCQAQPDLCLEANPHLTAIATAPASVAQAQLGLLRQVNLRVNSRVRQMRDVAAFGVEGLWTRAGDQDFGAAGDCKAIAIEKRVELEAAGVSPSALYYAIAYRGDIGLHAVLVAHTDAGDLVLDSRTPAITPWRDAPYTWVRRQALGEAFQWASVPPGGRRNGPIVMARASD